MAIIELHRQRLQHNFSILDKWFEEKEIQWAVVTKLLCGNALFLNEVISLGIDEVCDSRVSNLKLIQSLDPSIQRVYIKPPSKRNISDVVKYADVSFNTEYKTIQWISEEAKRQQKDHKVVIMIELGDLREGVLGENLLDFYAKVFELPNINVVGLGANLNCLHGVMPSQNKLIQLSLYKQLIEAKFNKKIPYVSGGSSVTLPLLFQHILPKGVNHFRIGESLFFGVNLFEETVFPDLVDGIFQLSAEIIEIYEKPKVPTGEMSSNPSGESFEINEEEYGLTTKRALVDLGVLDIAKAEYLTPEDPNIEFVGASSDMIVLDVSNSHKVYHLGDTIRFKPNYMGTLGLMSSNYIEKIIVDKPI